MGRLHVTTLMKRMRIEAIYRRPNKSKPTPGHKIYPYLLRTLAVRGRTRCGRRTLPTCPWQAASSISSRSSNDLPGACWRGGCRFRSLSGFASRRWRKRRPAMASRRSPTATRGRSSRARRSPRFFTAKIAISMDSKGCWRDNVFVERLWRSVKYEEEYLHAYASVPEARAGIGRYIGFYNAARPLSALGGRTPDQIYFDQPLLAAA